MRPLTLAVLWGSVAAFFILQNIAGALALGRPISWQWNIVHELIYWSLWAAVTPLIVRQAQRHWLEPGAPPAAWVAHGMTAVVLAPAQVLATYALHATGLVVLGMLGMNAWPGFIRQRWASVLLLSLTGMLYYALIVGGYYVVAYRRLYLAQRTEAARARLDALQAQLQPHFLFNALHSIGVLIDEAPARARTALVRLSDLLDRVLAADDRHEIPLGDELSFLDIYLDLQRLRFEDRLRVTITADADARRVLVPAMILQPLVENAVRHAVEPRPGGGRVTIDARRDGPQLRLVVRDDGPGLPAHRAEGGIGLANTRHRLEELYGEGGVLQLESPAGGGLTVTVTLPFRVG